MDLENIRALAKLMKAENLKVVRLETEDTEIYLEAFGERVVAAPAPAPTAAAESKSAVNLEVTETTVAGVSQLIDIKADQIGTFYTQPEEDSEATFVSVGDQVAPGDQIGLIETMKIFTEVLVDQSGTIEEILVANGETVEYDQVLMRLRSEEG